MSTTKSDYYVNSRFPSNSKIGGDTEILFEKVMTDRGNKVVKSSVNEDIFMHIDFWVDGIPVDVKGNRRTDFMWLELVNVQGHDGWLKGKADYIVMNMVDLDCFYFFYREDLLEFVVENVTQETTNSNDFLMFYNRSKWGFKDKITKCRLSDIEYLVKQKICY